MRTAREPLNRIRSPHATLSAAWTQFLAGVEFDAMASLTFDPKRVFPVSRGRAEHEAVRWCQCVAFHCRRNVGYLVTTERHRSGLWHAHALLAGFGTSRANFDFVETVWRHRNGIALVRTVRDSNAAVGYVTKRAARPGHIVWSDNLLR